MKRKAKCAPASGGVEKVSARVPSLVPPPLPEGCNLALDEVTFASSPPPADTTGKGLAEPTPPPQTNLGRTPSTYTKRHKRHLLSTSWASSIVFHVLALLVLLLILAPADFGGTGTVNLVIAVDQNRAQEQLAMVETIPLDNQATPDSSEAPPPDGQLNHLAIHGIGSMLDGAKSGLSGSTGGTFFGIEAGGHEFVYVLDMSGSMRGRRFERASAELIRSVEQLGPHQRFYVLLFSSGTTQMFGQTEHLPQSVTASMENKRRLAYWLRTAYQGGGTDPREALRLAMRMNPSAVFMLSDGEFNGKKNQKKQELLGGNTDAFSIVEAASNKLPIHTIAFEDKSSRGNMQRIAELTNGDYRFVGRDDNYNPEMSLKRARTAMLRGNRHGAELILREAVANLRGTGQEATQAKTAVGDMLMQIAKEGLQKGETDVATNVLDDFAQLDRYGRVTGDQQTEIADLLLDQLHLNDDTSHVSSSLISLTDFVEQFPNSPATKQMRNPLAQMLLDQARADRSHGEIDAAVQKLERAIVTFSKKRSAAACQTELEQIADELLSQAYQLRLEQGDVDSAQHLCQLAAKYENTHIYHRVVATIETQATEMLTAARQAGTARDHEKQDAIKLQIEQGFGDEPHVAELLEQAVSRERKAQRIYNSAMRLERSQAASALRSYRVILSDYADTQAARVTQQRLQRLGWWRPN